MNFKVSNLGAIEHAQIALNKKLTVFCGPNGTGKTYLSYLIFALARVSKFEFEKLTEESLKTLLDEGFLDITIDMQKLYAYRLRRIETVSSDLAMIYGLSNDKVSEIFNAMTLEINEPVEDFQQNILDIQFEEHYHWHRQFSVKLQKIVGSNVVRVEADNLPALTPEMKKVMEQTLLILVYNTLILYPVSQTYFLPVERSSIFTFGKEIYRNRAVLAEQLKVVDSSVLERLLSSTTNRYPLPISLSLEDATDLYHISQYKGEFYDLATEIERDLLKGSLHVTEYGDVEFLPSAMSTKTFPISLTASLVKTLSPLIMILKHQAVKNDLIIIDEPELNLHPDAQILFVRIMAGMIQRGLRLLISTHSDYIIREINNLIMIGNASEDMKKASHELGYADSLSLDYHDVGAYLFDFNENNRVEVTPVEVQDDGFEAETIDQAIAHLNATSEQLYNTLRYGE